MKHVVLSDWSEFEARLRAELKELGHHWFVTVRNFERVGFEGNREVDRFKRALKTGTDRNKKSRFWNADGHDFEHDRHPSGKSADELIYAFTLDLDQTPYKVLHESGITDVAGPETVDEGDAIIVYDYSKLDRKSENEYWFKLSPNDAALLIFTIEDDEDEDEGDGDGQEVADA